jgi:hypothetical protein
MIKSVQHNYAYVKSHRILNNPGNEYLHIEDAEVEITPDVVEIFITELGRLFLQASSLKKAN